nr:uncharacterized protein LOC127490010 isoform X14 [Oryctolagus cuniculus]
MKRYRDISITQCDPQPENSMEGKTLVLEAEETSDKLEPHISHSPSPLQPHPALQKPQKDASEMCLQGLAHLNKEGENLSNSDDVCFVSSWNMPILIEDDISITQCDPQPENSVEGKTLVLEAEETSDKLEPHISHSPSPLQPHPALQKPQKDASEMCLQGLAHLNKEGENSSNSDDVCFVSSWNMPILIEDDISITQCDPQPENSVEGKTLVLEAEETSDKLEPHISHSPSPLQPHPALQKPQKDASEMCLQGLAHLNKEGENSSNSDDVCFVSSWNMPILIEDDISITQCDPQPENSVEGKTLVLEAEETSDKLEPHISHSPSPLQPHPALQKPQKDASEMCLQGLVHLNKEGENSSNSDDVCFVSSWNESILIEDESSTLHQCDAQPAYSLEEKTLAKKSDETSDEMDCHLGHSDSHVSPISEISKALENASESCATFSSHPKSEEYFSNSDVDCFVSSLSDSIAVETKDISITQCDPQPENSMEGKTLVLEAEETSDKLEPHISHSPSPLQPHPALQKPQKDASEMCLQGLAHLNKEGENSSNSDDVCFVSSWNMPILIEDESSTLHQCDAQPAYSLEEKTLAKKSDETSDEMDCHLGHSDSHVSPISEISKALENASESCATFSSHPKSEEYFSNSDVDCFVSSLSDSIAVETKDISITQCDPQPENSMEGKTLVLEAEETSDKLEPHISHSPSPLQPHPALQKPQKDASEMCLQGLAHLNKEGENSSNSDDVCFVSSWNESILIEDDISITQCDPQPENSVEGKTLVLEAEETSDKLEPHISHSPSPLQPHPALQKPQKDASEMCLQGLAHLNKEGENSSNSDDVCFVSSWNESILIEDESSTLHQCDAQPAYSLEEKTLAKKSDETSDEMDCHLGHSDSHVSPISEISKALENASESCATFSSHPKSEEYFSNSDVDCFVSSLSDSIAVETKEICKSKKEALCIQSRKIPLLQDLKQHQTPYPTQCRCFNFHLAHEPCTPETHMRKERLMKVYYTRVQRKRNASVVCYTQDELVPPGKRSEIEDVAFPVKIRADPSFCYQSSEYLVTDDSTYSVEDKEQDQEASSCQAVLSAAEENLQARASTPEWLVTPERGFKCMACCQVFSSLGDLVDHVKHGVKGDFSCQVFHLAFTWLESKRHMMEKRNKRKKSTRKTSGYKEK